jgi:hypothetical protein
VNAPPLTFFVELPAAALVSLFEQPQVSEFLSRGGHSVSLGMLDTSPERAEVVRALSSRGIPVTAWLLLTPELGYWLTADNAPAAIARYREVREFARRHGLSFARIGLDIEAPKHHLDRLLERPLLGLIERVHARRSHAAIAQAEQTYRELVAEIHRDGLGVESYQFPVVLDERNARSTLLRRTLGLVQVPADLEVFMLYQSYFGRARIRSYFPEVQAIALGVTGGGVNADKPHIEPRLSFEELEAGLLDASRYTRSLYVFSLEGCVEHGMLEQIERIDWTKQPEAPRAERMRAAQRVRWLIQWVCARETWIDRALWPFSRRAPDALSAPP